tara:strand:+ start:312 stop:1244 length:933 start_codon:yes stop_codon:yes gene_type:complete
MTKKIVEITTIEELIEMASVGAGAIQGYAGIPAKEKDRKTVRREPQTEQLLRKYIRNKINTFLNEEKQQEQKLRVVIRSLIKEAKDQANPHPSTGINKLRDAFRKAKPSIKTKFQQLTTSEEQRTSFVAHLLNAFISLFDQLDALNAQGKQPEPEAAASAGADAAVDTLAAPPEDEDIEGQIEKELQSVLQEIQVTVDDDEGIDVVSDEKPKEKTQVEKDVDKKQALDTEREEFGSGLTDMDKTGRNQSFDTFRLVQSYFSDAYLDLDNQEDRKMFRQWCLYNLELLLKSYQDELNPGLEKPEIENPEGA